MASPLPQFIPQSTVQGLGQPQTPQAPASGVLQLSSQQKKQIINLTFATATAAIDKATRKIIEFVEKIAASGLSQSKQTTSLADHTLTTENARMKSTFKQEKPKTPVLTTPTTIPRPTPQGTAQRLDLRATFQWAAGKAGKAGKDENTFVRLATQGYDLANTVDLLKDDSTLTLGEKETLRQEYAIAYAEASLRPDVGGVLTADKKAVVETAAKNAMSEKLNTIKAKKFFEQNTPQGQDKEAYSVLALQAFTDIQKSFIGNDDLSQSQINQLSTQYAMTYAKTILQTKTDPGKKDLKWDAGNAAGLEAMTQLKNKMIEEHRERMVAVLTTLFSDTLQGSPEERKKTMEKIFIEVYKNSEGPEEGKLNRVYNGIVQGLEVLTALQTDPSKPAVITEKIVQRYAMAYANAILKNPALPIDCPEIARIALNAWKTDMLAELDKNDAGSTKELKDFVESFTPQVLAAQDTAAPQQIEEQTLAETDVETLQSQATFTEATKISDVFEEHMTSFLSKDSSIKELLNPGIIPLLSKEYSTVYEEYTLEHSSEPEAKTNAHKKGIEALLLILENVAPPSQEGKKTALALKKAIENAPAPSLPESLF